MEDARYGELVDTLFATPGSFLAGVFGGLIAPLFAYFVTSDGVYLSFAAVIAWIGLYRVYLLAAYSRTPAVVRRRDAKKWELRYGIGAVGFMTAVGSSVAFLFYREVDHSLGYYAIIIMMSGLSGLAGRNAGRPNIVVAQTIGLSGPLAIASLLHGDAHYFGIAPIFALLAISVYSTTKFLHANLKAALRYGVEASMQRKNFASALDSMSHGLCMGDSDMKITVLNRRLIEFFGIVAPSLPIELEALARAIAGNAGTTEASAFVAKWKSHASVRQPSIFSQQINDRIFDFRCESNADGFVTVVEDVTGQRLSLQKIERLAHYDDLTSLPNRVQFRDQLECDLRLALERGQRLTLLTVDLDRFKEVNDTLGHSVGDELLRCVAARLPRCVRPSDIVARFGGDEFCILLRPEQEALDADLVAKRVIEAVSEPCVVRGHTIVVGASVGICVAPDDACSAEGLLKCGDLAMYHSKAIGGGEAVRFEPAMQEAIARKRRIEEDLRRAVLADELVVFYQPVIDARDGRVTCCEALLRWRHAQDGLVSPADFIPVAEETGLIVEVGEWVLRRACRDALNWPSHVRVAVNFSAKQLQQKDVVSMIAGTLVSYGLEPQRLEVEITETALMQNRNDIARKLGELRALGVRLSLDDFGTGYSSLCYLNDFPVKKVKIDRSFVERLVVSPKTQAIVSAVALLARELDIDLVAEGVETHAQLALLATSGVHLIQGYLFNRPEPLEQLAPLLAVEREHAMLKGRGEAISGEGESGSS